MALNPGRVVPTFGRYVTHPPGASPDPPAGCVVRAARELGTHGSSGIWVIWNPRLPRFIRINSELGTHGSVHILSTTKAEVDK